MGIGSRPINMSRLFALAPSIWNRRNRIGLFLGLVGTALLMAATAHAQFGAPPTTPVHEPSALRPPAGARVAIVEFEDMECPDCANANPLLKEATEKYQIPGERKDFPSPCNTGSSKAPANAPGFDT